MSRILIIQSHGPNAPQWVRDCCEVTQAWARGRGYDYRFVGDEIFDTLPQSFGSRKPTDFAIVTRTDYGRLKLIRNALEEGYAQATWIDSDVYIFDPGKFDISEVIDAPWFACQETWHDLNFFGRALFVHKINNAIIGASSLVSIVDLLTKTEAILSNPSVGANKLLIGPDLLGRLRPIPVLLRNTGCLGKSRTFGVLMGPNAAAFCRKLRNRHGAALYAANLCSSLTTDIEMRNLMQALKERAQDLAGSDSKARIPNVGHSHFYWILDLFRRRISKFTRGNAPRWLRNVF
jgi:hypothetical protein